MEELNISLENISKTELLKIVHMIIDSYEYNEKLNDKDFKIMYELIKRHPDSKQKIGCGIKDFIKTKNQYRKPAFKLIRTDGSRTDFSYINCITPKKYIYDIKAACRNAIRKTIISFREKEFNNKEYLTCPITKKEITKNDCHVDHQPPYTFNWIFQRWIKEKHPDYNIKLKEHKDEDQEIHFEDEKIKESFIAFHNKYAILRILSAEAHRKGLT